MPALEERRRSRARHAERGHKITKATLPDTSPEFRGWVKRGEMLTSKNGHAAKWYTDFICHGPPQRKRT